ncbi:hypothetical protein GGD92_15775 [Pseudomonas protegens]|jgi:hypothetical protein|uniref:Uncharacterized protein n=1 Tax=Pseudomonas protegens TaxID=380021 RepID=A0A7G8YDW4_9PSED|nr:MULTISPECIES: hypothetical protein [Pseudomonas]QNH79631.1 hypothetical protein GGI48_10850 [Pseudomonas protegens]QNL03058.1 hypothetical protein GGD92_15775 [Pseudomonas protegens]TNF80383.1 hypothetical protein FGE05_21715 [Pseudomonas sp. ICMP22404]
MFDHEPSLPIAQAKVINRKLSVELYGQLMYGKMINRTVFIDGGLKSNPYFEEVLNNFDHYRSLYDLIGYELVMRDGFAYIRTSDGIDARDDLARNIQGLLLVLFRGALELGFTMDVLLKDSAGLSNIHIEEIGKAEDKVEVLIACGMKSGMLMEHIKKLETRAIAYRNGRGNLVLSESGAAFFDDLLGEGDLDV